MRQSNAPFRLSGRPPKASPARRSEIWARSAETSVKDRGAGTIAAAMDCLRKVKRASRWFPAAITAITRFLGIRGPAYFVNPSSLAPALIAYGATIRVFGSSGKRDIPAEKFFLTPKSEGEREYDLKSNEILTEIIVPMAAGARGVTYEVRQKEALDWPLAAASVVINMAAGKVRSARVVLGHVAPVPWRSQDAEAALVGHAIDEKVAQAAAEAAVKDASPLSRNGYKVQCLSSRISGSGPRRMQSLRSLWR